MDKRNPSMLDDETFRMFVELLFDHPTASPTPKMVREMVLRLRDLMDPQEIKYPNHRPPENIGRLCDVLIHEAKTDPDVVYRVVAETKGKSLDAVKQAHRKFKRKRNEAKSRTFDSQK